MALLEATTDLGVGMSQCALAAFDKIVQCKGKTQETSEFEGEGTMSAHLNHMIAFMEWTFEIYLVYALMP